MRSCDAHIAPWGNAEAVNGEALPIFLGKVPSTLFTHSQRPSGKTISDRFKRLVARLREQVEQIKEASAITETDWEKEKEQILDEVIAEIDYKEEALKLLRDKHTRNKRRLVVIGK